MLNQKDLFTILGSPARGESYTRLVEYKQAAVEQIQRRSGEKSRQIS